MNEGDGLFLDNNACTFGFTWNIYILPRPNLLLYYLNIVSISYLVILVVCLKHLIELLCIIL